MNAIIEKRHAKRVNISCELRFRIIGSDEFHEGCCIDLSSSGISFCSDHAFQIGEEVEVHVLPEPPIMFSTTFIVKVLRTECRQDGLFKIAAIIEYTDGNPI